jgi:hypothetical protein
MDTQNNVPGVGTNYVSLSSRIGHFLRCLRSTAAIHPFPRFPRRPRFIVPRFSPPARKLAQASASFGKVEVFF